MLSEALAEAPLTPSEYAVYSFLFEHPHCTPTQMAQGLGMPMQTASDWLANLRRRRHITTTRSIADGRSYTVSLTTAGRAAQRATNKVFDDVNRRYLESLPKSEHAYRTDLARLIHAASIIRQAAGVEPR
jgi:DNA-binding MarR family transcriptional regulator